MTATLGGAAVRVCTAVIVAVISSSIALAIVLDRCDGNVDVERVTLRVTSDDLEISYEAPAEDGLAAR
jgi:hypothetical protein